MGSTETPLIPPHACLQLRCCSCGETTNRTRTRKLHIALDSFAKGCEGLTQKQKNMACVGIHQIFRLNGLPALSLTVAGMKGKVHKQLTSILQYETTTHLHYYTNAILYYRITTKLLKY